MKNIIIILANVSRDVPRVGQGPLTLLGFFAFRDPGAYVREGGQIRREIFNALKL
jgi:hypothetical protein